jgi:site-specific recombinase XerD
LAAYRTYLEDTRGLATKTVQEHLTTVTRFLDYLTSQQPPLPLVDLTLTVIDDFVTQASKQCNRASLQHVVAHLRGFFFALSRRNRGWADGPRSAT